MIAMASFWATSANAITSPTIEVDSSSLDAIVRA